MSGALPIRAPSTSPNRSTHEDSKNLVTLLNLSRRGPTGPTHHHPSSLKHVAHCIAAEAKLNWAFKLYDVDNDGVIDLYEMAVIIEMMDNLDGVKPGKCSIIL